MPPLNKVLTRANALWIGFSTPLQAFRLIISHPKLLIWSLIPTLLTLGIYSFIIAKTQNWGDELLQQLLMRWSLSAQGWLFSSLKLLVHVFIFLAGALSFSIVATVIASPLNDFLAEASEAFVYPPLRRTPKRSWLGQLRLIFYDVSKSLAATVAALLALVIAWIPILNVFSFLISFLLISFQYLSYPQTRRGIGIGGSLLFLWKNLYLCIGFGAAFAFLFSIPIFSCFFLPLAVVGGTQIFALAQGNTRR